MILTDTAKEFVRSMPEKDREFFILGCGFTMGVVVDQVSLLADERSTKYYPGVKATLEFLKDLIGEYQKELTSDA